MIVTPHDRVTTHTRGVTDTGMSAMETTIIIPSGTTGQARHIQATRKKGSMNTTRGPNTRGTNYRGTQNIENNNLSHIHNDTQDEKPDFISNNVKIMNFNCHGFKSSLDM